MATGYNVRVGDADRDAIAAQLREHYADGRLTLEELNERLDQAFAARTKADLNTVMRDLPQAAGMPYGGTARQGPAWPGPMGTKPGQDNGNGGWGNANGGWNGGQRPRGFGNTFAPLMGLIWFLLILGSVFAFGFGRGERPLVIVLIFAALALFRRLFGLGTRRRYGGPRGPRGPRGRRR